MSQPIHEPINMTELPGVETRTGRPQLVGQNHPPWGESGFVDGSGPLFSMYLQLAGEEDKKMTDNWKGDADGILIFTGLFSAAVATLVAVSVQDLKPNSQDISAFYLANIYQVLTDPNGSQVLIPPLSNPSIPFSPPASAVWVNSLWFLSLVSSLTCALLATLLQQWARRYMKVTQTRYSPHKRARIRAFFAEGVDKLHLPWAVEALPGLLHLSLFLFFAGLVVFLFNINHTVFNVAVSWVGFCTGVYMCITFLPVFRHDSPYYAPLSSLAWYLYIGTLSAVFRIFTWATLWNYYVSYSTYRHASQLWESYLRRISQGIEKEFEETALEAPSEIDGRALMWTYEALDEDHELEQFFAGLPGFCGSKVVDNPQPSLDGLRSWKVGEAFSGFLERTWTSNLVSETTKIRRLVICIRAVDVAYLSHAAYAILDVLFLGNWSTLSRFVELGHSLISWGNNDDRETTLFAQGIISCSIANVLERNERWFSLTMDHLGISEHVLRDYLDHGNSVSLANMIHFTHYFVRNFPEANWEGFPISYILRQLKPYDNVQNSLPGLRHDFCGLWNGIVLQRRDTDHPILSEILGEFHAIYVALHQGSPYDEFQLCSVPSHRIDAASNLNETAETAHAPITTSPALHYHDSIPSIIAPVTEYDVPPSPTSNLGHPIPDVVDGQSGNGLYNITPVASSFDLSPLQNDQVSDGTTANPIQGIADPSLISSMVNTGSCSTPSHGTASRPTGNTITATPSFIFNTLLTIIPDPGAPHISADPTANQSGRLPDDRSISVSSSQNFTSSSLAPQVISGFDSNATKEIGPLDTPDDTLDPNRSVISQPFAPSSPDVAE